MAHLLPAKKDEEEAAFLFVSVVEEADQMVLACLDWWKMSEDDFESRSAYHFELKPEVNAAVIKHAHDLNATVVEFHSHINQDHVRFSPTDWRGFLEFVPHVRWRLQGKPYVAVVVSGDNFDALVWRGESDTPSGLHAIQVGVQQYKPTNNSLKNGKYEW